LQNKKVISGI